MLPLELVVGISDNAGDSKSESCDRALVEHP